MQLPTEIWHLVALKLPFLDLLGLASSCKTFHLQFALRLQLQQERLRARFCLVRSRPRGNAEVEQDNSNSIGVALELTLLRELHPSFIRVILCDMVAWSRRPIDYDWGSRIASIDHGAALRRKIDSIPWIYEDERQGEFQAIAASEEETALRLLLPTLGNLEVLRTYGSSSLVHNFVGRIARDTPVNILPKLRQISDCPVNGEDGLLLAELARKFMHAIGFAFDAYMSQCISGASDSSLTSHSLCFPAFSADRHCKLYKERMQRRRLPWLASWAGPFQSLKGCLS